MKIQHFYDQDTATFTFVVSDETSQDCAVIDSVLNFDIYSGKISTTSADLVISYIKENNLNLQWILETHIHADHLTASSYLKEKLGGKIGVGSGIKKVLNFWVPFFDNAKDTPLDGSQFDQLFADNAQFLIGNLCVKVLHTPGHTPACVSYLIEDSIFVGDTIFAPQMGTARTDFEGGDAATLFQSIQKILALPDETKIFVGHDYPKTGGEPQFVCTVLDQKKNNILVNEQISAAQFVETRNKRDIGKAVPKLLLPAIQVNLRAGKFGEVSESGAQFLKIPLNKIG